MPTRVLLLEDDLALSEIVKEYLEEEGFEVELVYDANAALDKAYEKNFDIYLFDIKVPLGDGFSLLKELRKLNKNVPAIFISSLNTTDDLKMGFEAGCDDYIKKPFELLELKIRINSLLKRSFAHKNGDFEEFENGFKFDILSKTMYKNGKIYTMPGKEIKLLSLLLKNKTQIVPSETIFEELWEYGETPSDMSLRVYIKNLKKIIGKDKIVNSRGRGYSYV